MATHRRFLSSPYIRREVNWFSTPLQMRLLNKLVENHHLLRGNHQSLKGGRKAGRELLSPSNCKHTAYQKIEAWPSLARLLQSSKTSVSTLGPEQ
jgi:hypothetical protein